MAANTVTARPHAPAAAAPMPRDSNSASQPAAFSFDDRCGNDHDHRSTATAMTARTAAGSRKPSLTVRTGS